MKAIMKILLTLSMVLYSLTNTVATDFFIGIDVSSYQGEINFSELASSGYNYLYIRVGEGENAVDTRFQENYQGAEKENLHYGFYYYVTAKNTTEAQAQAKHFANLIEDIPYTLCPAMDFEVFTGLTTAESNEIALSFLKTLEELTSVKAAIYSDAYNVETRWSSEFSSYPLWIADYAHLAEPETYTLPKNSPWVSWSGYQYTDSAVVSGIDGNVDGDLFTSELVIANNSHQQLPQTTSQTTLSYTVKQGDTLWKISEIYQTSVDILMKENDIANKNLIFIGEILKIPMRETYTVKSGDNLTKIALEFHTTVDILVKINHIPHVNLIYIGETLYIP